MTSPLWLIASDLHGDAQCTAQLLHTYEKSGAARLILLGDLLYHGPRNDLPTHYAPKEVIRLLNEAKTELLCVRGNCDTEVDQMVLDFPILSDSMWLCDGNHGVNIFATHGHRFHTQAPPPLRPGDILLHGHTHIPAAMPFGENNVYLNPGSITLPKENWARTYMIYQAGIFSVLDFEGNTHLTYQVRK